VQKSRQKAVTAAHGPNPYAEGYGSGAPVVSANARTEVSSQAVVAAHSPNPYAEGYGSGAPIVSANSRAAVRSEAVAAAYDSNQNLYREAFFGSVIPEQYTVAR
jgi:hypothetical protein